VALVVDETIVTTLDVRSLLPPLPTNAADAKEAKELAARVERLKIYTVAVHPLAPHLIALGTNCGAVVATLDAAGVGAPHGGACGGACDGGAGAPMAAHPAWLGRHAALGTAALVYGASGTLAFLGAPAASAAPATLSLARPLPWQKNLSAGDYTVLTPVPPGRPAMLPSRDGKALVLLWRGGPHARLLVADPVAPGGWKCADRIAASSAAWVNAAAGGGGGGGMAACVLLPPPIRAATGGLGVAEAAARGRASSVFASAATRRAAEEEAQARVDAAQKIALDMAATRVPPVHVRLVAPDGRLEPHDNVPLPLPTGATVTAVFGGPFLAVCWRKFSPDKIPRDAETQLYAVAAAADGSGGPPTLTAVGPALPEALYVEWDASGTLLALFGPGRVLVFKAAPGAAGSGLELVCATPLPAALPGEVPLDAQWIGGTLAVATWRHVFLLTPSADTGAQLLVVADTAGPPPLAPAAEDGGATASLATPFAVLRPPGYLQILGVAGGALLLGDGHDRIHALPVAHPLTACSVLAHAGDADGAVAQARRLDAGLHDLAASVLRAAGSAGKGASEVEHVSGHCAARCAIHAGTVGSRSPEWLVQAARDERLDGGGALSMGIVPAAAACLARAGDTKALRGVLDALPTGSEDWEYVSGIVEGAAAAAE